MIWYFYSKQDKLNTAVVEKIVNYKITLTFDVIDSKYEMQRQLPKQRCTLKMQ